jgi:squalene synthase HpnC
MNSSIPPVLNSAYKECQKLAFGHYENFPVASLLLPRKSRPHVAALYAFARTADDFADEPIDVLLEKKEWAPSPEAKSLAKGGEAGLKKWRLRQLDRWEKGLRSALAGKKAPEPLRAFAHTLRTFHISPFLPFSLLRAFRMDIVRHRYSTWNALLYYCRHSANPVGRMVLSISGIRDEKLHRLSDFICSGLQLINFWQDTSIDLARGRIYYPKTEWKKAGVRGKDLLALKDSPSVRKMVKSSVDFTEAYFRKGYPLLDQVHGRLGLELKATYLGGKGILNNIRKMDYNVLQTRPAWSAGGKLSLVLRALIGLVTP